jgi:hypothetical protein
MTTTYDPVENHQQSPSEPCQTLPHLHSSRKLNRMRKIIGFIRRVVLPILGGVTPVLALFLTTTQIQLNKQQLALDRANKKAATAEARRDVYVGFIEAMEGSYRETRSSQRKTLVSSLYRLEAAFMKMEAYMSESPAKLLGSSFLISKFSARTSGS